MSHHLGDAFYRHASLKRQRPKSMATDMKGKWLPNTTSQ